MTRLATRKEMREEGWQDITINGVDCIQKIDQSCNYRIIAEWTDDGWTTPVGLAKIAAALGEPYKIHTFYDGAQVERIASIEY